MPAGIITSEGRGGARLLEEALQNSKYSLPAKNSIFTVDTARGDYVRESSEERQRQPNERLEITAARRPANTRQIFC